MVRRRNATLSLTAAALLAATPLITSCGAQHPGAAAVVGGRTISVAALQTQVKQVRAAQNATDQADQMIDATSDLSRSQLNSMVFDQVLDRAAHDAGVSVTTTDVQRLEASAAQQVGGAQALRSALLQQYAVAPGQIDEFYRVQAEAQGLARHLGVDLTTQSGQAAVTKVLSSASQELRVDVNPRYGKWNTQTLTLGSASQPWLRQSAATSAPPQQITG
ncbi:SurA N-terminal domain-containing protein [Streptomyces sp. PTM05]|uniref:SurA N-terminal domain-containing protein n=1 Tax=Streptantibioticus parmotrematis TaxID=2873249 RepID=A0ABS7QWZ3_9ACTN|nr:SurA N-terminal domain-containing protein [Streptantibioticus parmotrematis]MBY8887721.1 SurA N-terminal domain-containing protein [Streptantibioticus parmotrematis]